MQVTTKYRLFKAKNREEKVETGSPGAVKSNSESDSDRRGKIHQNKIEEIKSSHPVKGKYDLLKTSPP